MNSGDRRTPAPRARRKADEAPTTPSETEFLLYETEDGNTRIDVRMLGETVWLSLTEMANLFGRDKSVISRHIKNVFDEGELVADSVVANFATTAADGNKYQVTNYNLDVIISASPAGRVRVRGSVMLRSRRTTCPPPNSMCSTA